MKIIEKDFKIEHDGSSFVLYFLKSKKELKEVSKEPYTIHGYYNVLISAFKAAIVWRKDKKYPFKELNEEITKSYFEYKKSIEKFEQYCNIIYDPIIKLKEEIFDGHRKFQNRN